MSTKPGVKLLSPNIRRPTPSSFGVDLFQWESEHIPIPAPDLSDDLPQKELLRSKIFTEAVAAVFLTFEKVTSRLEALSHETGVTSSIYLDYCHGRFSTVDAYDLRFHGLPAPVGLPPVKLNHAHPAVLEAEKELGQHIARVEKAVSTLLKCPVRFVRISWWKVSVVRA